MPTTQTSESLSRAERWDYDRARFRDLVDLLRAVGAVLSGVALVAREVRHFTRTHHPRREQTPVPAAVRVPRKSFWKRLPAKQNNIMQSQITLLYRPVGPEELALIAASGYQEFPPRLPDQPIFYPVTNEEYATQIARDWNVRASGAGYVTRFAVQTDYLSAYKVETVGSSLHQEYWIPAGDLPAFNAAIAGEIEVIAAFHANAETDNDT